jgi:predicted Ser/Thr protein kinase
MVIKKLKGHSGCKILLCEENNKKFVRKISHSSSYNNRLRLQMEKQKNFHNKVLKTPKVLSVGYDDNGNFYFDMEYIGGVSLSRYIGTSDINNSKEIVGKLLNFCISNKTENFNCFDAVNKKLLGMNFSKDTQFFEKFKRYCMSCDWSSVPSGFCHGDLTFENIIVYKSDLYLIDFLDSFLKSPHIDISKMLQDLLVMWSWRDENVAPFIKNIILYDELIDNLTDSDRKVVYSLLVVNLLRIIPYADSKNYTFVKSALSFLGNKLKIR